MEEGPDFIFIQIQVLHPQGTGILLVKQCTVVIKQDNRGLHHLVIATLVIPVATIKQILLIVSQGPTQCLQTLNFSKIRDCFQLLSLTSLTPPPPSLSFCLSCKAPGLLPTSWEATVTPAQSSCPCHPAFQDTCCPALCHPSSPLQSSCLTWLQDALMLAFSRSKKKAKMSWAGGA